MKIVRKVSLIFIIVAANNIMACDRCNDADRRETKPIYIKLINEENVNLVDAIKGPYFPDSVKIISELSRNVKLRKRIDSNANDPVFELVINFNDSGYLLAPIYLDRNNSDTIEINYKKLDNECATVYEFEKIKYNGKSVEVNEWDNILYIKK
jgi:hypothetical protein